MSDSVSSEKIEQALVGEKVEATQHVDMDEEGVEDGKLKKNRYIPTFDEVKHACFKVFSCKSPKFDVRSFSILDKMNKNQSVFGFVCKRDGPLGGSLYITSVGGQSLTEGDSDKRELVYATPKLRYAYNKNFNDYVDVFENEENIASYYLSEKWNGTNILLFKYHDKDGNEYISGKTKGMPTLTDSDFGTFLTSTLKALHLESFIDNYDQLVLRDELLKIHSDPCHQFYNSHLSEFLTNKDIQAISFEVCGNTLPHLVKYDFELDLKPLFFGHVNGKIRPCIGLKGAEEFGPTAYYPNVSHATCVRLCKMLQKNSLERNQAYREKNNLKHKYEYEHFIIEGHVLYLLDKDGFLVTRNMYKVKPSDVEEVHWERFDEAKKGQVRDVMLKMKQRGLSLSDENALRQELDCGDKEWGKFGREILAFVKQESEKPTSSASSSKDSKPKNNQKQPAASSSQTKEVKQQPKEESKETKTSVPTPKKNNNRNNKNKVMFKKAVPKTE